MRKQEQDKLLTYAIVGFAGYYLVIKPILVKLNILPDAQEKLVQLQNQQSVNEQAALRVPKGNRTYSNAALESLVNELYDSTNSFAYDYPIVMRSFAYFAGFTNADALYFLKTFAKNTGITLYQWQREKFANSVNYKTVDLFPAQLNKYKQNYRRFGWTFNLFNASFDPLAESATSYVYVVAKIAKK